jgi:hypothetical protein
VTALSRFEAPTEHLQPDGISDSEKEDNMSDQADAAMPEDATVPADGAAIEDTATHQDPATWDVGDWRDKMLVDCNGERIGKLQEVYVDVENDEPQFGTVKEGFFNRHLTFVPLGGIQIGPDDLQVVVSKEQVRSAPDIELHGGELSQADESSLYHHFELNYTPPSSESGRRLARR